MRCEKGLGSVSVQHDGQKEARGAGGFRGCFEIRRCNVFRRCRNFEPENKIRLSAHGEGAATVCKRAFDNFQGVGFLTASPSSSMSHKSNELFPTVETPAARQTEFVEKMLSGSQKKTAFALRMNAERLVREDGLHCTGFLTLTVGDYFCETHGKQTPKFKNHCPVCKQRNIFSRMQFCGIYNADEASERINSVREFLLTIFSRAILVSERHKNKALHFHLLGSLANGADIRSGLNFDELRRREYRSASEDLKGLWKVLRNTLPKYGFGRHELLPIKKTGDAVAAYISKYIEKNVCQRSPADRRKKLVRYIGWKKNQLKPNEFEWDGLRARAWRAKTARLFEIAGCQLKETKISPPKRLVEDCAAAAGKIRPKCLDGSEIKRKFGARWAMKGTEIWSEVFTDDKLPFLEITPQRLLDCQKLLHEAEQKHLNRIMAAVKRAQAEKFEKALRLIQKVCPLLELPEYGRWEEMDEKYLAWGDEKFEVPDDYFPADWENN